ncbi:class I SAM-dependent methyltransferase [Thaumasiovibrio subtropicus]|uniref:class I SAM-dependent methyltransferase n=1 Tax=Thaumasiovibrio subtropicus TaxID=1891207 RepID=UPI000B357B42|nr:class I SAM-dependent methyltransferase [Thaumasiovibrio subtropicus]
MSGEMYSRYAGEYDQAIQDNIYNALLERPSLQALLGCVKDKKVLDLGCGSGIYIQYLLDSGAKHVTGIDLSESMLAVARTRLPESVLLYAQDLSVGLPQEADSQYDCVICPLAVHYLEDLSPIMVSIERVLKPGGIFVFSTHHPLVDFEVSPSGNYFSVERIVEEWDTIGKPVEVQFYRRSLTSLLQSVFEAGMLVSGLTEGKPAEAMKEVDEARYRHLSTNPNFIFVRCLKPLA